MKLLIENLNSYTSSQDLSYLLGDLKGFITSWIKRDQYGTSEGFGYARFESPSEGRKAINRCNGMRMHGKKVKISPIKETPLFIT
ncbi:MAG: RNA-binding protein [Bdellovibrionales bacterium]|nr:RNA-binding protein [Bdellovibrionales bacterium]